MAGGLLYLFYISRFRAFEKLKEKQAGIRDFCVYQIDIYNDEQWLEIMPKEATKTDVILSNNEDGVAKWLEEKA